MAWNLVSSTPAKAKYGRFDACIATRPARWSVEEPKRELRGFERELRAAGATAGVVETYVTEESFTAKVIDRGGRKGRYFWAPSREVAVAEFGAEPCRHRADPV